MSMTIVRNYKLLYKGPVYWFIGYWLLADDYIFYFEIIALYMNEIELIGVNCDSIYITN